MTAFACAATRKDGRSTAHPGASATHRERTITTSKCIGPSIYGSGPVNAAPGLGQRRRSWLVSPVGMSGCDSNTQGLKIVPCFRCFGIHFGIDTKAPRRNHVFFNVVSVETFVRGTVGLV